MTARFGGTQGKKAAGKAKSTLKQVAGQAKKATGQAKGKAKSTVKQTKSKAAPKSGAGNWYGPERPKFLGEIQSG